MHEAVSDNPELPLREYGVPRAAIPSHFQAVREPLERAARRAVNMYVTQRAKLEPVLDQLDYLAREDRLAKNPYTVPDDTGRFIFMHQHPEFEEDRQRSQEDIRQAARTLSILDHDESAAFLNLVADNLDRLDKERVEQTIRAFVRQRSEMSFVLTLMETERGKRWWEGYLGFMDKTRTEQMQTEADRYRQAWIERNGREIVQETNMRFEYAAVLAGRVGTRPVSAKNSSAEGDNYSRIATFAGPFWVRYHDINLGVSQRYMDKNLQPTYDGTLRFLHAHEYSHNDDYPGRLGILTQPTREAAANFSAIDLVAREVEKGRLSEDDLIECIRGSVGYSLADCNYLLLTERSLPDILTLAKHTVYDLASTVLLSRFLLESGLEVRDRKIASVDPGIVVEIARELYVEESRLLQTGSYMRALKHFEENLPSGPFTLDALSGGEKNGDMDPHFAASA